MVHGNTQDFLVSYPIFLTRDAIRRRTEEGVQVCSCCIQDEGGEEPGECGNIPCRTPPWDGPDASRRPLAHVKP